MEEIPRTPEGARTPQGGAAKAGHERIEAEMDARVRAIALADRERGNTRAAPEVHVRHVDPASLRPAGWEPPVLKRGEAPKLITAHLVEVGPATIRELAEVLAIGQMTVRTAVNELIEASEPLVVEEGKRKGPNGPPAMVYRATFAAGKAALAAEQSPNGDGPHEERAPGTGKVVDEFPEPGEPDVDQPIEPPDDAPDEEVPPADPGPDPPEPYEVRKCERDGCEEMFTPPHTAPHKRFCSTRCQDRARKPATRPPKTCKLPSCGNEFVPKQQREEYCSDDCRSKRDRDAKRADKERRRRGVSGNSADKTAQKAEEEFVSEARRKYMDTLLERAATPDASEALLDRIERLVGLDAE